MSDRPFRRALAPAMVLALAAAGAAQAAPVRGLTGGPGLARAYDLVYDADFDGAETALNAACPPAPDVACAVVSTAALWWRISLDPDDRGRDDTFLAQVNAVIADAERWTAQEPERAEAWFYLGASYGLRVQLRVLRTDYLPAARDGKRIKNSLERAIALDPTMSDAYFGVGLYQYYAAIAPAALRFLRWLLFLPGGNRSEGLQRMLETQRRGVLLRSEADYQLHVIDLWYEHKFDEALVLLQDLRARYPHNFLFVLNIAQVQSVYLHDHAAALASYRNMLGAARGGRLHLAGIAEVEARLGVAAELDALYESDLAIEELQAVIAMRPAAPHGAAARALLALGRACDRLGLRDRAVAAYRAALTAAAADDPRRVRERAQDGLDRAPDRAATEAYRLSLDGWRALQRGALDEAARWIERAAQLAPADAVVRFRRASLLLARHDPAQALADFERVIQARPRPPDTFVASAYVEAARLLESRGERARAVAMYESAAGVRGAEPATRQAAARALARLQRPR